MPSWQMSFSLKNWKLSENPSRLDDPHVRIYSQIFHKCVCQRWHSISAGYWIIFSNQLENCGSFANKMPLFLFANIKKPLLLGILCSCQQCPWPLKLSSPQVLIKMINLRRGPTAVCPDFCGKVISLSWRFLSFVKHPPYCYGQTGSCWFATSSLFEKLNVVQPAHKTHIHPEASWCSAL